MQTAENSMGDGLPSKLQPQRRPQIEGRKEIFDTVVKLQHMVYDMSQSEFNYFNELISAMKLEPNYPKGAAAGNLSAKQAIDIAEAKRAELKALHAKRDELENILDYELSYERYATIPAKQLTIIADEVMAITDKIDQVFYGAERAQQLKANRNWPSCYDEWYARIIKAINEVEA